MLTVPWLHWVIPHISCHPGFLDILPGSSTKKQSPMKPSTGLDVAWIRMSLACYEVGLDINLPPPHWILILNGPDSGLGFGVLSDNKPVKQYNLPLFSSLNPSLNPSSIPISTFPLSPTLFHPPSSSKINWHRADLAITDLLSSLLFIFNLHISFSLSVSL